MLEVLERSFYAVFASPATLLAILFAATYGVVIGAIPGLTATMAVALLVPITYHLDPVSALAAIVALEACAIFAGDLPNALLRIPGTPASSAYTEDAYALTRRGYPRQALGVSLLFSVVGGIFGAIVLMAAAPAVARFALFFTSVEYFWLAALGLSCAGIVASGSRLKGALALLVGLLLSTVGLSPVHGTPRFVFGTDALIVGVHFIPAMIGLFGLSEVLRNLLRGFDVVATGSERADVQDDENSNPDDVSSGERILRESAGRGMLVPAALLFVRRKWHALRSMVIGTGVGVLPGAGADIGAWVSMAASKKTSRHPGDYGKGSIEGLSDASAANNAALGGAWVPSLIFGIPGDSVTAIAIGVLLMQNVKPGPKIFEDQPELVYSVFFTFIAANLLLLPLGYLAIRGASHLVRIPRRVLLPAILLFCTVGAYALYSDLLDVWIMLAMGVLGFALEAFRVPLGPVVLGLILGAKLEEYFIRSVIKNQGSVLSLLSPERPIALVLGVSCILIWVLPPLVARWRSRGSR